MKEEQINYIIKLMKFANGKYKINEIFRDLVALEAYFILFSQIDSKEYKDKFNNIIIKYNLYEQQKIWEILLEITNLYNKQRTEIDILGNIYNKLELKNDRIGQFLTPTKLSTLIDECSIKNNKESIIKTIEKNGFITLHEPSCGAGGTILECLRTIREIGYKPSKVVFVNCWDIDVFSTYMTYVQLSMYDIPAIIINGDTLLLDEKFALYTPQYYIGNWERKGVNKIIRGKNKM